jgi:hypothetical protein
MVMFLLSEGVAKVLKKVQGGKLKIMKSRQHNFWKNQILLTHIRKDYSLCDYWNKFLGCKDLIYLDFAKGLKIDKKKHC